MDRMDKRGDESLSPRSQEEHPLSQAHQARVGSEVAKATCDAALRWEEKLTPRTFALDPAGVDPAGVDPAGVDPAGCAAVDRWMRQHGVEQGQACLEATGESGAALARARHAAGRRVSIVNPARIAA
jgi:hypothetical protein